MHVLAAATSRAHPFDDAIGASEREGVALDADVAALVALLEPTAEARAHIWQLAQQIGAAAGREAAGDAGGALAAWARAGLARCRAAAGRLFGPADPLGLDLRATACARWAGRRGRPMRPPPPLRSAPPTGRRAGGRDDADDHDEQRKQRRTDDEPATRVRLREGMHWRRAL
jgi:hypothetical protein